MSYLVEVWVHISVNRRTNNHLTLESYIEFVYISSIPLCVTGRSGEREESKEESGKSKEENKDTSKHFFVTSII